MIKTIEEITRDINAAGVLRQPEKIPGILREWVESVIIQCSKNAKVYIGVDEKPKVSEGSILSTLEQVINNN